MNKEEQEYAVRPNKTQLKRELKALHELSRELVNLPRTHFDALPLSERIKEQIFAAKHFKKAALQRQLRFISGLMQEEDIKAIREALRLIKRPHKQNVERFHQLETWRDQLIAGNNTVFADVLKQYPHAERQYMRQLIRNANKEAAQNRSPKAARLLFQYLQALKKSKGSDSIDF